MTATEPFSQDRLARARAGDRRARSDLLAAYRNYLRMLARAQLGARLAGRVEPSDLVQEALLDAHRDLDDFRGETEEELLAWLRRILARNLADEARRHQRLVRDQRREVSIERLLDRTSRAAGELFAGTLTSPSRCAERREEALLVADALASLPSDHQEVIVLRHVERLKFDEIARRMGRESGAVRMLWVRALEKLRSRLGEDER